MSPCGCQPKKGVVKDRSQLEGRTQRGGSAEAPSAPSEATAMVSSKCGGGGEKAQGFSLMLPGSLP